MSSDGETHLVATVLPSSALAPVAVAAWASGEAIMPLDPATPAAEIERLLHLLRPTHLLDPSGRHRRHGGVPVPAGTAAVVATSGTTGAPKGVVLTRAGLVAMAHGYSARLEAGDGDRWLACVPLHHVAGLAILGRAWVTDLPHVVHDGFDLARVAASPTVEGTTIVSLVPTMLLRLLDTGAPLREYRRVIVGGAPCPPDLRARALSEGVALVETYGLSETWGGCVLDGTPIPGCDVRTSEDGEILVRGSMVMRGYRFAPELTAGVLEAEGWLRTGDVGSIAHGVVTITDRSRDIVISGGVNISPTEVEGVLARHPGVSDIGVAGSPDPEWGERVVAYVVPADRACPPTLDALRAFARDHLVTAKLPREIVVVDRIPRTSSGKPRRRLLCRTATAHPRAMLWNHDENPHPEGHA